MNKVITDGLVLNPAPFANGLNVYSSGNGTPGSDTYANAPNAAFVPADQDFGGALEILKNQTTQQLRYMGQTPLLPGCYLRVTVRIKAVSGSLPSVRIAGYPALANGNQVSGVPTFGPSVALTSYGEVVEVSAIIGGGERGGVDMVWGTQAVYGHIGFDLTGQNGGVVRVDDIIVEDVTGVFLRDMISQVDVRDYGAVGDGSTDDTAAFEAANSAADGRTVFVPAGIYRLESNVSFDTPVKFEGTLSMPADAQLLLRRNFDLPAYIEAFEDEEEAFRKAFQALLNNVDHESLDLGGRKIWLTEPLDLQAAVPGRTSYLTRRAMHNGQFEAAPTAAWDTDVVTSQATYAPSDARTLTNVTNIGNIQPGSYVEGNGVGRETYVRSVDVANQRLELNHPLYDADGTQNFTFSRFKYLLDFSNFVQISKFGMTNIEFQCNDRCSAILLPPAGNTFRFHNCFFSRPMDRGITSHGGACQGMLIDRCQFLSAEDALNVSQRSTVGFNVNSNDAKIRNNRATRFRHFGLLAGQNNLITGNHFFQGDSVVNGVRSAGLILANNFTSSILSSNYVDNCFIEWTNELDPTPGFTGGFSFASISITNNVFLCSEVAPWFSYIVVKPHGAGHFLNGVSITGNLFRSINGTIDRAERVDTSFSDLDMTRNKDVVMQGNGFHNVTANVSNPAEIDYTQNSTSNSWQIDCQDVLPFGGDARQCETVVAYGPIRNGSGSIRHDMPYVDLNQGGDRDQIRVRWPVGVEGRVMVKVRMDNR